MQIVYEIQKDHASVHGYIGTAKDVVIPPVINGNLPVTEISAYAFDNKIQLQRVIFLGDTIRRIGQCAFHGCRNLRCIGYPNDARLAEHLEFLARIQALTGEVPNLGSLLRHCEEEITCLFPNHLSIGPDAFKGTPLEQLFHPLSDEKNP